MAKRLVTDFDRQMAKKAIQAGAASPEEMEDWKQQLADFDEGIDITPYTPRVKQDSGVPMNPQSPSAQKGPFPSYNEKQLRAASRGLDIDTGVPANVEFGAQFANNENEKIEWYKKSLAKELGYDPGLMASKDFPGQYEYLRKGPDGKKRRTLVTGGAGSVAGAFAGSPAETVLGTGGVAVGGLLGGGIPGAAAGGALLGGLGALVDTPFRDMVGREAFGINQPAPTQEGRELQARQLGNNAMGNAALSTGVSLGTDALSLGSRFLKYWFKGLSPIKPTAAKQLLNNAEAGQELVRKLNEDFLSPGGTPLSVSIPAAATTPTRNQRHNVIDYVPTPVAKEAMALESQVLSDGDLGEGLRTYHETANEALMDIYDNVNKKAVATAPAQSSHEAGSPILEAARMERGKTASYQEFDVEAQEAEVRDFIQQNFPNLPEAQLVAETKKVLGEGHKYWKENEKLAWDAWEKHFRDEKGNFKEILLPVDEQFASFLREDAGKKFYTLFKNTPLISTTNLNKGQPLNPADMQARSTFGMNAGDDPQQQVVGLYGLTSDIKDFRARLRQAEKANGFTLSAGERKQIEVEMRNFRDRALDAVGRPEIADDLARAERFSKLKADRYNQGIPLKALGKKRDTFTSKDISVLADILRYKDKAAYDQFVMVMREAPGGPQKMRELFLGAYQAEALDPKSGLPTPAKHAAFMKKYGWAMKEWNPHIDLSLIDDMKKFADETVKGRVELQKFDQMYAAKWGRIFKGTSLENLNAADLVDGVWTGKLAGEDVTTLLGFVQHMDKRQGSNLEGQWKAGILQSLRDKITSKGKLSSAAMDQILEERSHELKVLFGYDYINNFNRVRQALNMTELAGAAKVAPAAEKKWFEYVGRALWAPPLSQSGRLMTLGSFLRTESYKKNVADLFTNPEALRYMANYSQKQLESQVWRNVMSRAFAIAAVDKND